MKFNSFIQLIFTLQFQLQFVCLLVCRPWYNFLCYFSSREVIQSLNPRAYNSVVPEYYDKYTPPATEDAPVIVYFDMKLLDITSVDENDMVRNIYIYIYIAKEKNYTVTSKCCDLNARSIISHSDNHFTNNDGLDINNIFAITVLFSFLCSCLFINSNYYYFIINIKIEIRQ